MQNEPTHKIRLTRRWPSWSSLRKLGVPRIRVALLRASVAGALAVALAMPAVSMGQGLGAHFGESAKRVKTTYQYDATGRSSQRIEKAFDRSNRWVHTTTVRLEYGETGSLSVEEAITRDRDGKTLGTALVTYEYDAAGTVTVEDRLWLDAAGTAVRRESLQWRTDEDGTRVGDTRVFDGKETLIETRYTVVRHAKTPRRINGKAMPRVVSRDEARYDISGKQTSRHLRELTHTDRGIATRTLFTFDENDEVTTKTAERWSYDGLGRLATIDARYQNGRGELTQTSQDKRTYVGATRRVLSRTYKFVDAAGETLRRLDERYEYDRNNRLTSRNGEWRHY